MQPNVDRLLLNFGVHETLLGDYLVISQFQNFWRDSSFLTP